MTDQQGSIVRSMTGQGHASARSDLGSVQVEIRTVNSRGFKCITRLTEAVSSFESKVESLIRNRVHRGTVHINVIFQRPSAEEIPTINSLSMHAYLDAIRELRQGNEDLLGDVDVATLLNLPGVLITAKPDSADANQRWELIEATIAEAVNNLDAMRIAEGGRMSQSLQDDCAQISKHLDVIQHTSPRSIEVYRQRLQGKIERVLKEYEVQIADVDLLREVQIYADRVDIHEEIVRLGSHLKMFSTVLSGSDQSKQPTGRKLDFILQEMFRETNTIGSKASDSEISTHVVEIKCAIERMRELVQNLE